LIEGFSPIDHLKEIAPNASVQDFRNFLGGWQFPGDRAFEVIDNFSGGEKARLALALIAWTKPNLLLLDEPTNHLDLEMREALAEALSIFEGAIVMVSHDRHLIGLVSDTYWRVHDGVVEHFDGDLDDYAAWLRSKPTSDSGAKTPVAAPAAPAPAPAPKKSGKQNPYKLKEAEQRVAELEDQLVQLDAQLALPETYANASELARLSGAQARLREQLETAEAVLLSLYDQA
jgi:ATP-binding cassette subfamily F protein 3